MNKSLNKISVIIPSPFGGDVSRALEGIKKVNYPKKLIEAFVVYGSNPSAQRNLAAQKAKGDMLYFLDNDSEIGKDSFKFISPLFNGESPVYRTNQGRGFSILPKSIVELINAIFFSGNIYKGEIGAVGGPNIWKKKENFWASIAGITLESFFVYAKMAARHRPIGKIHRANEKELILCNLAVKKKVFSEAGGFNENLYPNEENELLNRIEAKGYQLIYHPGVIVCRQHRQSLFDILKAFFRYGEGRMEQIRVEGVLPSLPLLLPLMLFFYLIGLWFYFSLFKGKIVFEIIIPGLVYLLMALGSAFGSAVRKKKLYLSIFLPIFFLLVHLTYAFGLIWGLFTDFKTRKRKLRKGKIKILKIKKFGEVSLNKDFYDTILKNEKTNSR